jgi:hypothetical protein
VEDKGNGRRTVRGRRAVEINREERRLQKLFYSICVEKLILFWIINGDYYFVISRASIIDLSSRSVGLRAENTSGDVPRLFLACRHPTVSRSVLHVIHLIMFDIINLPDRQMVR